MSYRPKYQSIQDPLRKILEGIEEFSLAVNNRIKDGDWQQTHLDDISNLRIKFMTLYPQISRMEKDNW